MASIEERAGLINQVVGIADELMGLLTSINNEVTLDNTTKMEYAGDAMFKAVDIISTITNTTQEDREKLFAAISKFKVVISKIRIYMDAFDNAMKYSTVSKQVDEAERNINNAQQAVEAMPVQQPVQQVVQPQPVGQPQTVEQNYNSEPAIMPVEPQEQMEQSVEQPQIEDVKKLTLQPNVRSFQGV